MLLQSWHNQVHISCFQCLEHVLLNIICIFLWVNTICSSLQIIKTKAADELRPIHFVNFNISSSTICSNTLWLVQILIWLFLLSTLHMYTFQKPGRAVKYLNWLCKGSLTFCNHFIQIYVQIIAHIVDRLLTPRKFREGPHLIPHRRHNEVPHLKLHRE